jgi:hypothetical protein
LGKGKTIPYLYFTLYRNEQSRLSHIPVFYLPLSTEQEMKNLPRCITFNGRIHLLVKKD